MVNKITDDEIPEIIEICLQQTMCAGKPTMFLESLQTWYEEKGFLTDRQYESLMNNYYER